MTDVSLTEQDLTNIKLTVLTLERQEIARNVDPRRFFGHLRAKYVLDERECDEIRSVPSRIGSAEAFIDILKRKGAQGYDEFCNALIKDQTQLFLLQRMSQTLEQLRAKVLERKKDLFRTGPQTMMGGSNGVGLHQQQSMGQRPHHMQSTHDHGKVHHQPLLRPMAPPMSYPPSSRIPPHYTLPPHQQQQQQQQQHSHPLYQQHPPTMLPLNHHKQLRKINSRHTSDQNSELLLEYSSPQYLDNYQSPLQSPPNMILHMGIPPPSHVNYTHQFWPNNIDSPEYPVNYLPPMEQPCGSQILMCRGTDDQITEESN